MRILLKHPIAAPLVLPEGQAPALAPRTIRWSNTCRKNSMRRSARSSTTRRKTRKAAMDPKQLQELVIKAQKQAQELQSQMQSTILEASAGGGAVTVKMNGQKRLLAIKIEQEAASDVEMLQDLIMAAVNEASRKVDEAVQSSVG